MKLSAVIFLSGFNPCSTLMLPTPPSQNRAIADRATAPATSDRIPSVTEATASETRRNLMLSLCFTPALTLFPGGDSDIALAAELPPSVVSPQETLLRLRKVPTFCIVDGKGTPFMTYDGQSAGANGYFFLEYENAEAVLADARKAYKEALDAGEPVVDSWGNSRIVTMPLDYAMRLTVRQTMNVALNTNGKEFRTIIQVLPTATDLDSALAIDGGARFRQRGRVPLFYAPGLELTAGDGSKFSPAYFNTRQLKREWAKQSLKGSPVVQVRELTETFRTMVKPGGNDESVRNLVFIASDVAKAKSLEIRKEQGEGQVYKAGEIILTK